MANPYLIAALGNAAGSYGQSYMQNKLQRGQLEQQMAEQQARAQQQVIENAMRERQMGLTERNTALDEKEFAYRQEQDKIRAKAEAGDKDLQFYYKAVETYLNPKDMAGMGENWSNIAKMANEKAAKYGLMPVPDTWQSVEAPPESPSLSNFSGFANTMLNMDPESQTRFGGMVSQNLPGLGIDKLGPLTGVPTPSTLVNADIRRQSGDRTAANQVLAWATKEETDSINRGETNPNSPERQALTQIKQGVLSILSRPMQVPGLQPGALTPPGSLSVPGTQPPQMPGGAPQPPSTPQQGAPVQPLQTMPMPVNPPPGTPGTNPLQPPTGTSPFPNFGKTYPGKGNVPAMTVKEQDTSKRGWKQIQISEERVAITKADLALKQVREKRLAREAEGETVTPADINKEIKLIDDTIASRRKRLSVTRVGLRPDAEERRWLEAQLEELETQRQELVRMRDGGKSTTGRTDRTQGLIDDILDQSKKSAKLSTGAKRYLKSRLDMVKKRKGRYPKTDKEVKGFLKAFGLNYNLNATMKAMEEMGL